MAINKQSMLVFRIVTVVLKHQKRQKFLKLKKEKLQYIFMKLSTESDIHQGLSLRQLYQLSTAKKTGIFGTLPEGYPRMNLKSSSVI